MELPDRKPPERKLPRKKGFDYSTPGAYLVTICTDKWRKRFWEEGMDMSIPYEHPGGLSNLGIVARDGLLNIPTHFPNIAIDKYVIMSNHIHCIIIIKSLPKTTGQTGAAKTAPYKKRVSLSTVVGQYKAGVSRIVHLKTPRLTLWQTSFYDHIIRKQSDYEKIRQKIEENPDKWEEDKFYECEIGFWKECMKSRERLKPLPGRSPSPFSGTEQR